MIFPVDSNEIIGDLYIMVNLAFFLLSLSESPC